MRLNRKFYVGSNAIEHSLALKTSVADAIEAARKFLANEPDRKACAIVQIIGVVKRAEQPIVFEEVE